MLFAIANAKCSEDTDKNLFNSLSFSLQQIQSMSNDITQSRILWRGSLNRHTQIHFNNNKRPNKFELRRLLSEFEM